MGLLDLKRKPDTPLREKPKILLKRSPNLNFAVLSRFQKEFYIGSLDFTKGSVVFEFIVQLFLINSLRPLKYNLTANYLAELNSCIQLYS